MNKNLKKIVITAGREKSLLRKHPWIFSGAVKSSTGAASGDIVAVVAEDGRFLAYANFSEHSQIVARVLSFVEGDSIDENFFRQRIKAAILLGKAGTLDPLAADVLRREALKMAALAVTQAQRLGVKLVEAQELLV